MFKIINLVTLFFLIILSSCNKKMSIEKYSENIVWKNEVQSTSITKSVDNSPYREIREIDHINSNQIASNQTADKTIKPSIKSKLLTKIAHKKLIKLLRPAKINNTTKVQSNSDLFGVALIILGAALIYFGVIIIEANTLVGIGLFLVSAFILLMGCYIFIASL
jgi:hypothetical protein